MFRCLEILHFHDFPYAHIHLPEVVVAYLHIENYKDYSNKLVSFLTYLMKLKR
jgi:hypothetical protein